MGRKGLNLNKYAMYDEITKKTTCLIPHCKKELSGKNSGNIKRHYKLVHYRDIVREIENGNSEDNRNLKIFKKMSSTERKKRSLYQYSQESLINALNEVRAGTSTILRASKKYGVPRSTIQDRIHGRIADNAKKIGSHTVLTDDEEHCVVKWCEEQANNGVVLKAKDLLDTVEAIVKKRQRTTLFINGRPGRRWYWRFVKRYPHLKFRDIKGILKRIMNQQHKIFWSEFLDLYKSLPSLWKIHSPEYTNRELKNKSYEIMVKKLKEYDADADKDKVIKKINVFRTNYKRVIRLQREGKGQCVSLWYFDKLKYLDDEEFTGRESSWKQSDATIEPKKKKRKVEEVTIDTPNQDHNTVNNTLAAGANESFNRPKQNYTVVQMPQPPQNQQQVQIQQQKQHQEQQATSRISDSCQQIAQIWGLKLAKMSRMQRIIAEKVVNEVMFNGELGLLNVNTALTNIGSRIDTDPIGSIDAENEEEFITIENKNIFDL
ncbi:hypothetical protein CVS40_11209 [Lucilia cuprina]|nr:hypothetical protein CVS40_11209 [Lucilia cuprina]